MQPRERDLPRARSQPRARPRVRQRAPQRRRMPGQRRVQPPPLRVPRRCGFHPAPTSALRRSLRAAGSREADALQTAPARARHNQQHSAPPSCARPRNARPACRVSCRSTSKSPARPDATLCDSDPRRDTSAPPTRTPAPRRTQTRRRRTSGMRSRQSRSIG